MTPVTRWRIRPADFLFSDDSLSCTAFGNHILIHWSKTQDLAAGSEEF